jgi:hypothetical protein
MNTIVIIIISIFLICLLYFIGIFMSKDHLIYIQNIKYFIRRTWEKTSGNVSNFINKNMLDKPINKKNKIAIVTFENRHNIDYINMHNKNISSYCDIWNYDYIFYDQCDKNIYWCKIYYVLDTLKQNKYDYVLWLDSDTIIKNNNISIDMIVNKYTSDIFMGTDSTTGFCAGVFIIKNSDTGISFLEDCISNLMPICITEDNKLKGDWAGMCYEQGVMNMLIFEKYANYTTCLPEYIIYNGDSNTCNADTFIYHMFASKEKERNSCFKRFV